MFDTVLPSPSDARGRERLAELRGQAGTRRAARSIGWARKIDLAITCSDLLIVVLAVGIAHLLRFGIDGNELRGSEAADGYLLIGAGVAAVWMLALSIGRTRDPRIISVGPEEYRRVVNATLLAFGLVAVVAFLVKLDVARGYLLVALPVGLLFLLLERFFWRRILQSLRRAGRCLSGAVIVGPAGDVEAVVDRLAENLRAGYRPVGVVTTDGGGEHDDRLSGFARLSLDELAGVAKRADTSAVMIAGNLPGGREQIRDISWSLENSNTELILVSDLTDVSGPRIHLRPIEGLPMVNVDLPQYTGFSHAVKRILDLVASAILMLVLAPVFAGVAIAIRLGDPGSVLFRQERVGVNGTRFTMYKFRSMVADAEARRGQLEAHDEGNGVLFKIRSDPRITPIGGILRRYSLDELPQLWNVFRGDMSLVGPRPPLPREVARYEDRVARRLLIKPGITGLWQVSGRSNLSWEESVKLDLSYVENWSVTGDLMILLRTLRAVVGRDGAY